MKKLVIFGTGDIAELAWFYFDKDSDYQVVGFTVDRDFVTDPTFCGLPVVSFDEVSTIFSAQSHSMFVALSYTKLNRLRRDKYFEAAKLGYSIASYISSRATMLSDHPVGENCFILENNTVQPFVEIGNNVTLWSGNHIGHHSKIEDHNFLASHIVVSGGVTIKESCFIGVNATLRDHITIGERCVLGAGTLILSDTSPESVYFGSATERSRVPSNRLRNI